jgi:DtxR family transcriptional regulator, Mn-dependent transcriptional regulator
MGNIVVTQPSASVGDYLKAVWETAGSGAASTKGVADRLSVSSASVTNMFARLQEMGLALYEPYRGASLTGRGRAEALRLVRRHRLIETFLLEHLGYSWEDVHEEAERLEHAVSDEFTERLAELLGHPDRDPHGAPIPASDGTLPPEDSRPLSGTDAGGRVVVSRVENRDPAVLAYLRGCGLVPGRPLRVTEVRALDGVVTAEDEDGVSHALGAPLARSILVRLRA